MVSGRVVATVMNNRFPNRLTTDAGAKALIAGKHVCIVDDVYTTGATVSALAKCLRRAGAGEISVLTFARVLPGDFRRARPEPI